MDDLFDAAASERLRSRGPLAARLRPATIDDIVGQDHLLGRGAPLRRLVESDRLGSVILWGPPGTGKTSLALAIAATTARSFEQLSAVTAGVADVRRVIAEARDRWGLYQCGTILFLDEIHRFSRSQQDALLPAVEDGTLTLIGATTENPLFEVNPPLRSRSSLFRLEPLDDRALRRLAERALALEAATATDEAIDLLVARVGGDGRQLLGALEVALAIADDEPVGMVHVEAALQTSALRYGRDDHYDVVSAFIKSIRGSDPDAAVYWLARMLEAGEDPRFIARRLVILASEDIGLADSTALVVATAAASAVEFVGLPEAQLNLAHATIHLAVAPKSNRSAEAIWTVRREIRDGLIVEVPAHLRDAHHPGSASIGHGVGYEYPHDHDGPLAQTYLPGDLAARRWYRPSNRGDEAALRRRRDGRRDDGGSGE